MWKTLTRQRLIKNNELNSSKTYNKFIRDSSKKTDDYFPKPPSAKITLNKFKLNNV